MTTQEENQAEEVGARLRQLREGMNKKQEDFAKILGIGQNAYSYIESGKRLPTRAQIDVIIDTFSVTYDWVMGKVTNNDNIILNDSRESYLPQKPDCKELAIRCEMQKEIIEEQKKEIAYLRKSLEISQNTNLILAQNANNQPSKQ